MIEIILRKAMIYSCAFNGVFVIGYEIASKRNPWIGLLFILLGIKMIVTDVRKLKIDS